MTCPLYSDPELYDSLFPKAKESVSERFYVDEARQSGGPVLEAGCGSGRLTIPIAHSGVEILGMDLSPTMLAAARSKALAAGAGIEFVEADMREFHLGRRFSTVLISGNSLLHLLTTEDLLRCLTTIRRHLEPTGRLIFDISKWDLARLARDPAQRYPVLQVNQGQRTEVSVEESASYDAAAQIRDFTWFLSTPSEPDFRVIEYRLRVIFPQELPLLLNAAGFRLETRYGEFTRIPFDSSSPRQVCICSVAGAAENVS